MRRRRTIGSQSELDPVINLTPLIDVVFVVLIMFILVAPLVQIDVIELAEGGPNTKEITSFSEEQELDIHVHSDNTIWIRSTQVDEEQLGRILAYVHQRNPHHVIRLFHDKTAQFGTYQIVKNQVEQAGFKQLDLIVKSA